MITRRRQIPLLHILVFAFLTISIGGLSYFFYRSQANEITRDKNDDLTAIMSLKIGEIEKWLISRESDGKVIQDNHLLSRALFSMINGVQTANEKEDITRYLSSFVRNHEYYSVYVINLDNEMLYLYPDARPVLSDETYEMAHQAAAWNRVFLTDLYQDETSHEIWMDVVVPVSDTQIDYGTPFALVILKIDPDIFLYPLLQTWPTSSPSAETLLVRQDGNDVLYLNELRHQPNSAFQMRYPIDTPDLPAAAALRGHQGIYEGKDYRGMPVLATLRSIPNTSWHMVSKVDLNEIYADIRQNAARTFTVSLLLITLAGSIILTAWRSQMEVEARNQLMAQQEREALRQHYQYLVQDANDIIIMADENSQIMEVNQRAVQIYGYTREQLLSMNARQLCAPQTLEKYELEWETARQQNGHIFETIHVRKNGQEFPVEDSARVIYSDGCQYYQSIVRDISERKAAEEEIKKKEQELVRLNRQMQNYNEELEQRVGERTLELATAVKELESFSYSVSHDLRAPLRHIDGYSQALVEDCAGQLDETGQGYITRIRAGTHRMEALIDALLSLSRFSRAAMQKERLNLSEITRALAAEFEERDPQRKVEWVIADAVYAYGDESLLEAVIQNLVENAWKFTSTTPKAVIEFGVRMGEGSQAIYYVRDNGIGFNMAYIDKMFKVFQRLHDERDYKGTGIGLATVNRIIQRHGGKVWAEGIVGGGATISFSLPGEEKA